MPIQVDGVLLHAISGTELSRVRTEFDPVCWFRQLDLAPFDRLIWPPCW